MHMLRIATLITTGLLALTAAEVELPAPAPVLTPVDQPVVGRVVILETGSGTQLHQAVPVADVQLWKGHDGSLGGRSWMALRDNGWSVALIRWDETALAAGGPARLLLPMGGVERDGAGRFSVHRMLVPWTEGAGWSHSGHAAWNGPRKGQDYRADADAGLELADPQGGKRQVVIDGLGALVAGWVDGSIPNHGILLRFDGPALQTSVPGREQLDADDLALVGQGARIELGWHPGTFERLVTQAEDLREVALELELQVPEEAAGGRLEVVSGDAVLASTSPATGSSRVTLTGLAPVALGAAAQLHWEGPGRVRVALSGRDSRPTARCRVVDHPAAKLFPRAIPFRDGVYVTVEDGHLSYGGERLRLWGTLGYGSKARIRETGFNAYRLWGPNTQRGTTPAQNAEHGKRGELPPTTRGDDSGLDQFDRAYAECRELGLWVMATFLMRDWIPGADEPGSFIDDGGDFEQWRAAVHDGEWEPGKLAQYVGMIDERFARVRERAASQILDRVNPYTGIRYAEDEIIAIHELANEKKIVKELLEGKLRKLPDYFQDRFREAWLDFLRARYADREALVAAWGGLREGESLDGAIALAPLDADRKDFPAARGADVVRFLCATHIAFLDRMRAHARSHAPEGVGVAAVPFSYDTQYRPHTPWAYTNAAADVQTFGMYFWNYGSDLTRPPSMYVMDQTTIAGKPTVIYETNRGRPSPHRSEYPFMAAAFGAWQDWDAIFFHYWGGPHDPAADEEYLLRTLANGNPDHFWTAVHVADDPVMCAALATAGQAFLGGHIPTAGDPVTVRVGAEGIFGSEHRNGIGQTATAFQRGSRLAFEPEGDFAVEWPADAPREMPDGAIQAGAITWDWPNGRLIVDTPHAKFLVGKTAPHTFSDGIALSGFDLPWAAVGVVSADGKPLADGCERALVSATAHAQNTGFEIDLTAKLGGPINQIKARRDNGHTPVVVDRVGFTLALPSAAAGELVVHDFALRERLRQRIDEDGALRLHGQEMYLGLLRIGDRGAARQAALDPMQVAAGATGDAQTLPSRDGWWSPLAGVEWDATAEATERALRARDLQVRRDGEHVVVEGGALLLEAPATIVLRYAFSRLASFDAEIAPGTGWDRAESALRERFGDPDSRRRGTQFEGSHARWTIAREGARFELELSDIQGVMRLTVTPAEGGR